MLTATAISITMMTTMMMMMMMMMTIITMRGTTIIIEVPPADTRTRTHTTTPTAKTPRADKILQTEGMAITAPEDQTIAGPSSRCRPVAQQNRRLRPIARLRSRPPLHREDQGDIASSSSGVDSA
ncbi:hypothetical protein BJX62DRAFT_202603 [Aspergillus germanicus]